MPLFATCVFYCTEVATVKLVIDRWQWIFFVHFIRTKIRTLTRRRTSRA